MNVISGNKNPRILLVEDNPAELRLIREIFKGFDPDCSIVSARDGVEATDILLRDNDTGFDIVILDLNLPRKSGLEVLSEIKQSKAASLIPIVVLSTSDSESDIVRSYELSANCYITKPAGLDNLIDAVKGIDNFWLSFGKRDDVKAH